MNAGQVVQVVEHLPTAASDCIMRNPGCVAGAMLRKRMPTMLRHSSQTPIRPHTRPHKSDETSKYARDDWCNSAARRAGCTNRWYVSAFLPLLGRPLSLCCCLSSYASKYCPKYHASVYLLLSADRNAETHFRSCNITRFLLSLGARLPNNLTSSYTHKDGGRVSTDRSAGDGEGKLYHPRAHVLY